MMNSGTNAYGSMVGKSPATVPISVLCLNGKCSQALHDLNLKTVKDVNGISDATLLDVVGIGPGRLNQIRSAVTVCLGILRRYWPIRDETPAQIITRIRLDYPEGSPEAWQLRCMYIDAIRDEFETHFTDRAVHQQF